MRKHVDRVERIPIGVTARGVPIYGQHGSARIVFHGAKLPLGILAWVFLCLEGLFTQICGTSNYHVALLA
jgi:hypothetical protein